MERFYGDGEPLDGETAIPEGELRNVLRAELHRFFRGTWRRAQLAKKTDAISKLAREMDMPVQLARKYEAVAREHGGNQPDEQNIPEAMRALDSPLFRVSNHHTDDCGQPPTVDGDQPDKYFGYFVNQYGEQAIFVYDYQSREAVVWMGDTDRGETHPIVDGRVEGVILNEPEATWIRACWLAIAKVR